MADLDPAVIATIRDAVAEAMRVGTATPQQGVMRFPEDDRFRRMVEDIIHRELVDFEKKVKDLFREEIEDTLRRIGIRVDDEHIDETADQFRAMLKRDKSLGRLFAGVTITFATGLFFGLLKLLGLNLPIGGGDH